MWQGRYICPLTSLSLSPMISHSKNDVIYFNYWRGLNPYNGEEMCHTCDVGGKMDGFDVIGNDVRVWNCGIAFKLSWATYRVFILTCWSDVLSSTYGDLPIPMRCALPVHGCQQFLHSTITLCTRRCNFMTSCVVKLWSMLCNNVASSLLDSRSLRSHADKYKTFLRYKYSTTNTINYCFITHTRTYYTIHIV